MFSYFCSLPTRLSKRNRFDTNNCTLHTNQPIRSDPNPSQPHLHHHNPPAQYQIPSMDPPLLNIPKATYQPGPPRPQNPDDDVEQQAGSDTSNPGPQNSIPNGQNSVRTRVFSGLLMLTVITIIVIMLVTTSVKPRRIHSRTTKLH